MNCILRDFDLVWEIRNVSLRKYWLSQTVEKWELTKAGKEDVFQAERSG